ncbi:MAG: universal stress protein [Nitrososphaeraceae archaeon]|jgi:nucleotide-binding universal stress UspA family protein
MSTEHVIENDSPSASFVKKVIDPDKDLESEYQKAKESEEEGKDERIETVKSSLDEKAERSPKEFVRAHIPQYRKILVPHDGSETSDKALAHAIYLSKMSNAEIVILNAVEELHEIAPTTISAGQDSESGSSNSSENKTTLAANNNDDNAIDMKTQRNVTDATDTTTTIASTNSKELNVTIQGRLTEMIKEMIELCKEAGVDAHVSYRIQTGSVVDKIVNLAKEINVDLIIMVSDRLGSSIKGIMSSTRKVIDAVEIPVLVLNK